MKNFLAATALVLGSMAASVSDAATLGTFGNPWGQIGTVNGAMDDAFGVGGWTGINAPADASFLTGETFVYLEGGSDTTNEMESFLTTFSTTIMSWISAGGSMLINAAPNEGNGLSFGGLNLIYGANFCGGGCVPTDPAHPIFTDIAAPSFGGNSFSHGIVAGGSSIIEDANGNSLLSEIVIGDGLLLMGTMTTTNWHSFAEARELRTAIITYGANVAPIPLPAAGFLLIGALGGLAALRRRKMAA